MLNFLTHAQQSHIKCKCRYYEELLIRAWRLRDPDNRVPQDDLSVHIGAPRQDWTWAGGNQGNPRFMLNADLCLAFDIDTVTDCCARIRQGGTVPGEGERGSNCLIALFNMYLRR